MRYSTSATPQDREDEMGIHENKHTMQRFDRLIETCEADALDEICAPDMTNHALAAHRAPGLEGTKEFVRECRSDPERAAWMRTMHQQRDLVTIAEGDYVIQFGKISASWAGGLFRGHEVPAGDYVSDMAFMYRFEDDRIAERWAIRDDLAMIEQLSGTPSQRRLSSV